jgi:23S rRNA (cytosine1962-C5)-methyltransferase
LNELDPSKHEFFKQDVEVFLKGSIKRGRKFDLIICDPPSFGRTKDGVFKLESAFSDLIKNCWESLSPHGEILFCSNLEKQAAKAFAKSQGLPGTDGHGL